MNTLALHVLGTAFCLIGFLSGSAHGADAAGRPALKDAFAGDFRVGVAVGTEQIEGHEPAALTLVEQQFNSISPENLLKWEEVHPEPDKYNFAPADLYVDFGKKHGMKIIGHTLVWHNQTPAWVFKDEAGNPVDRATLLDRMHDHIQAVVGRYKGRINGWDVVNEALDDDGNLRPTPWKTIIGDDYIEKAFQFAHEADPDAELYYNDFDQWKPGKRRAVNKLVNDLKSKGIRIDGIGIQGHWGMDYPSHDEMEAMFDDYDKLGVKLMVTELDINLLPQPEPGQTGAETTRNYNQQKKLDPYADGLPDSLQQSLADRYAEIFACFLRHRDTIDRVTFWGVHDGNSWLNYWPIQGRTAYPLLFDRQLQPKPAFDAVIQTTKKD
jgi:endo-1,4-beta-xylanase